EYCVLSWLFLLVEGCGFTRFLRRPSDAFCFLVKTLLLWDIDGTLIASGGAGMKALQVGLRNSLGIEGSLDDIEFAGRTDRWIVRRIFEKFQVPQTEDNFQS